MPIQKIFIAFLLRKNIGACRKGWLFRIISSLPTLPTL